MALHANTRKPADDTRTFSPALIVMSIFLRTRSRPGR